MEEIRNGEEIEEQWQFSGRVAVILASSMIRYLNVARQSILEMKHETGALTMQTYFRSTTERSEYLHEIFV